MFLELVFDHTHDKGTDLEVGHNAVELTEAGETEEDVDNVGSQLHAVFPFLTQDTGKSSQYSFCIKTT